MRYPTKTSTKKFCDIVAASIARYEKYRYWASRAAKRGGFPIWTCPSFFVLFCPFSFFPDFSGIFPICAGMVRGFSRFVLFLFLSLLRAPTRNSPKRVRDTIWTFPEKSGKHPGLETPGFSFSDGPQSKPLAVLIDAQVRAMQLQAEVEALRTAAQEQMQLKVQAMLLQAETEELRRPSEDKP